MEQKEFDSTLGGTEQLPFLANSLRFATSRSIEVSAMTESILRPSKTKLIFQSLPVHMRRRVMSHHAKRLPIKNRRGHMEQLKKSGLVLQQKRPSRKYRRRPTNLLKEYFKRQKNCKWLETHLWHAKRFHMIQRWDYKLPYAPCDKAFRACYRASSAHCLLQDISYYVPIRVEGAIQDIKNSFSLITTNQCNVGITAKAFLSGNREGFVNIYHKNQYPFGHVGKISYIWESNDTSNAKLWLFVHPSLVKEFELLLSEVCQCKPLLNDALEAPMKKIKLEANDTYPIKVKSLQGHYNRFHLTGPKSHAVLVNSLKCIFSKDEIEISQWRNTISPEDLRVKYNYWQKISGLSSPSPLPSRIILGLIVKDPRLSRPSKRTKATVEPKGIDPIDLIKIPTALSSSPLWDTDCHKLIKENMLTNAQLIQYNTETNLVPGEINENDQKIQSIPIILVQNPGSQEANHKKLGFGSSWDIIVPEGYGLPFWQTFIMFGARAGGLREMENIAFEMGECYMPPDSKAGFDEESRIEIELKDKYFRRPPSKRVNYIKLAVNSPFKPQWQSLLNDWSEKSTMNFFVLRDRIMLENCQKSLEKTTSLPKIVNADSCLVPVYIQMVAKGKVTRNAMICLPNKCDLIAKTTPVEPQHQDVNALARKQLKRKHIIEIKQKRRKYVKQKIKGIIVKRENVRKKSKTEPSDYVKTIRELWLPSQNNNVRFSSNKEIMGYLSQAAFSFSEAKSCGVGYLTYNSLNLLLENGINRVLIRNISSRKYRWATIKVIR